MVEFVGGLGDLSLKNAGLEVLLPVAPYEISRTDMVCRPETLQGKTVGLFWNRKPNGNVFLLRVGERLKGQFKDVTVLFLQGKGDPAQAAPDSAIAEARKTCDAVILATGD
jgi:hypothetical protein